MFNFFLLSQTVSLSLQGWLMTASANSTNERHLCSKPQSSFWQAPCRDKVTPTPSSPCTHRSAESTAAWEAPGSRITWSLDRKKQDAFPVDNVSCCPKRLAVQKLATFATSVSGRGTRRGVLTAARRSRSSAERPEGWADSRLRTAVLWDHPSRSSWKGPETQCPRNPPSVRTASTPSKLQAAPLWEVFAPSAR